MDPGMTVEHRGFQRQFAVFPSWKCFGIVFAKTFRVVTKCAVK
jgi:hypothetical protein